MGAVIEEANADENDDDAVHIDGRRLRGERTRTRVLEALLALVDEGELHPTAQSVANRAGVALRTVYHHFEDVEALRGMALEIQIERHRESLVPVELAIPIDERIVHVVRQVRWLFEAITPIRRATLFDESDAHEMTEGLRRARTARLNFIEESFSPELDRLDTSRREILDAIDVATSWYSWFYIRKSLGRSATSAEAIVATQLRSLLAAA